jgi:hypothetical protein
MRMRRTCSKPFSWTSVCCALLAPGCVGGSTEVSERDKDSVKKFVLSALPGDIPNKLNIVFDGKIALAGYKIEPRGTVKPGAKVKLTMYWRCDKPIGQDGWNLFTHVLDGSGERVLNIDNVGPLREWKDTRQLLWPSAWEAGKVYVDEQTFDVPNNLKTEKLQVVVGIWKDNDRLKITAGAHDRENRAIVVNLSTGQKGSAEPAATTRVPELRVDRLEPDVKLAIDGKLDEDAWKSARMAGPFVDVRSGKPNTSFPVNGSVKLLWNDEALFLGFDVKDPDVVGGFKKGEKDPHLWEKDCVEIMVDPDGDGDNKDYYEIQINPQNLVFDSQFDEYNQPKTEPKGPFGHQDWSAKLTSAVTIEGTLDKSDDKDVGYVVEVMLPWKSFSKAKQLPPKPGDRWRVNFYAMQNNGGVAWSAILGQGNFHKATRFGKLLWAERGWAPSAPPAPAPMPPASVIQPMAPRVPVDPNRLPRLKLPPGTGPRPVK